MAEIGVLKRRGRPPGPSSARLTDVVMVKVTADLARSLRLMADAERRSVASYVRDVLLSHLAHLAEPSEAAAQQRGHQEAAAG